jgi:hypothetical protein
MAGSSAIAEDAIGGEDDAFLNQPAEPEPSAGENSESKPGESEEQDDSEKEEKEERKKDHAKQGFVSVLAGTGWFMVAPYDKDSDGTMCGYVTDNGDTVGEPVCTGQSAWHLDMLAGYGVIPGLEVFAIFRLGLAQPKNPTENQPLPRQIGAGIKVYTPKDGLFKIGFGVAPLFDFSDYGSGADLGYDFVIHVPIQAQFDFIPWFGAYLQVSPNISFISSFRLEFTGGLGVQARFP